MSKESCSRDGIAICDWEEWTGPSAAKAEGIESKPAFRDAFQRRRCLVPVDNFYEWKKIAAGKQPYAIALADRSLMALAGLYPLDILVLMDAPVVPGCVIRARPVGAIEAKQKTNGGDWYRNDRLIAVATHAQTHQNVHSLGDLRPHLVDEIKEFFIGYNRLRGRKFKPLALSGPDKSRKLIKSGMDAFEKQSRRSN